MFIETPSTGKSSIEWFHGRCIGLTPHAAKRVQSYLCPQCTQQNQFLSQGPTPAVSDEDDLSSLSSDFEDDLDAPVYSNKRVYSKSPTQLIFANKGGKVSAKKSLFMHMQTGEISSSEVDDEMDQDDDEDDDEDDETTQEKVQLYSNEALSSFRHGASQSKQQSESSSSLSSESENDALSKISQIPQFSHAPSSEPRKGSKQSQKNILPPLSSFSNAHPTVVSKSPRSASPIITSNSVTEKKSQSRPTSTPRTTWREPTAASSRSTRKISQKKSKNPQLHTPEHEKDESHIFRPPISERARPNEEDSLIDMNNFIPTLGDLEKHVDLEFEEEIFVDGPVEKPKSRRKPKRTTLVQKEKLGTFMQSPLLQSLSDDDIEEVNVVKPDDKKPHKSGVMLRVGLGDELNDDEICPVCDSDCTCHVSNPPLMIADPVFTEPALKNPKRGNRSRKQSSKSAALLDSEKRRTEDINVDIITKHPPTTSESLITKSNSATLKKVKDFLHFAEVKPEEELVVAGTKTSDESLSLNDTSEDTDIEVELPQHFKDGTSDEDMEQSFLPAIFAGFDSESMGTSSSGSEGEFSCDEPFLATLMNVRKPDLCPKPPDPISIVAMPGHDSDATVDEISDEESATVVVFAGCKYADPLKSKLESRHRFTPYSESDDSIVEVEWSSEDEEVEVFEILPYTSPTAHVPKEPKYPSFVQGVVASSPVVFKEQSIDSYISSEPRFRSHFSSRETVDATRSRKISLKDFGFGYLAPPNKRLREESLPSILEMDSFGTPPLDLPDHMVGPIRAHKRARRTSTSSLTQIANLMATSPHTFQKNSTTVKVPESPKSISSTGPACLALDQVVEADLFATSSESGSETESEDSETESHLRIVTRFDKFPVDNYHRNRRLLHVPSNLHGDHDLTKTLKVALKGHAAAGALSLTLVPVSEFNEATLLKSNYHHAGLANHPRFLSDKASEDKQRHYNSTYLTLPKRSDLPNGKFGSLGGLGYAKSSSSYRKHRERALSNSTSTDYSRSPSPFEVPLDRCLMYGSGSELEVDIDFEMDFFGSAPGSNCPSPVFN
jgi:hypothetical protein